MTDLDPHPAAFALPSGDELREMRDACDLTQSDVSERCDVSTQTLSQWEHGQRNPSVANLRPVLALYRAEFPELDDSPTPPTAPDGAYECPICGVSFGRPWHVTQHIGEDHDPEDVGLQPTVDLSTARGSTGVGD